MQVADAGRCHAASIREDHCNWYRNQFTVIILCAGVVAGTSCICKCSCNIISMTILGGTTELDINKKSFRV